MRGPDRLLSREASARLLANAPKPVHCKGVQWHGHMGVEMRTATRPTRRAWSSNNQYCEKLRRTHGPEYAELTLYCFGAGESIIVRVAAYEAMQRDYLLRPFGYGISTVASYATRDPSGARRARDAGVAGVLACSAAAFERQVSGEVIPLGRYPKDATTVLERTSRDIACRCGSPSRWTLTDTATSPWTERAVCDTCAAALVAEVAGVDALQQWLAGQRRDRSLLQYLSRAMLQEILRPWQHLPMPPAVAELAARARAASVP